ncbi:golgin subfamily A member 6-like protein 22 [Paramacrobiotus metropolitanus]|uniref:golgin subfamily A member 6-like protein 22 n=1 Tax=Paramacrobiotus metropolitanus TaxID=2943436 RepID=UPI002445FD9C|nr:golgin subfamily A member 6-like protein 22 [Paramacrobiotus metropolitanus]
MDKDQEEPTSNSSQGSKSSRSSQQGAPNPYKKDLYPYSRPVGHERNTRAPKAFEKKDSRGSNSTYQKALEAVANQESSSDDQKNTPASVAGSDPMNQKKVTGEEMPTGKGVEPVGASQLDATISGTNEQDKNVNLTRMEMDKTKVTEMELAELGLDDLSLHDKTVGDDLWATPMVSDESNESYFTDDEATMNMSFQTAMKEADRAEGMTPFKDIPEHLIERTQTGKVINVRPPSPNSPTSTLKRRVKDLEDELHNKEDQTARRKQEYQERLTSLETRLFELEQQRGYLENTAEEWKVKYEKQRELAEEYLKMVDDREMEGHLAVSDLNESMSEESAERSRHLAELKDECDQLRQKVTEAETKRDEYATKFAEVTQRLTTLATETFKLRNDLKLREEAVSTLQLESKGHQERADEAEKLRNDAIKAMREARDITATEGERLKEDIKKVNQENEKVTEDIEKVTKEGLKWQKEARRLDTMVTTLELKDKEWQQQVAQKSQEIAKLNTDLVEMTTTALAKDDELIAIKDQLRSAAGQYQQLENETSELVEHIKKMERENEKVTQQESFKLQEHLRKVNLENSDLKREREELQLRTKRLEDENKALQTSNKHKDEQLLQYGVKTATVESPPPSYSKAHETGTGKSFHFEMPLRTGTGKGSVKAEREGEKGKEDKEPPSESYPHMSRGDPSQFPPHIETNVFIDEGRRDRPPSRQERPRKSRYGKTRRNQSDDGSSEEDDDQRAENTAVQLTKALNSMARKTPLMTFDGSRDTE